MNLPQGNVILQHVIVQRSWRALIFFYRKCSKTLKMFDLKQFFMMYLLNSSIFLYFWSALAMAAIKHGFLHVYRCPVMFGVKIRSEFVFHWNPAEVWGRACPSATMVAVLPTFCSASSGRSWNRVEPWLLWKGEESVSRVWWKREPQL